MTDPIIPDISTPESIAAAVAAKRIDWARHELRTAPRPRVDVSVLCAYVAGALTLCVHIATLGGVL